MSSKIYNKRGDFIFNKVNFPFLDGDVPRRASYGVYISQLILQNAEKCDKTPGQEREPKLLRLTGPLNNSKGSL